MIKRLVVPPGSTDSRDSRRIETCLAVARLVLASASLLAIAIDRFRSDDFPFGLILAYVPYSVALLALLLIRKDSPSQKLQIAICAADIAWIGAISGLQEPNSPYFGFLTFVLVGAAYRWGFLETLITGLVLWVVVQAVVLVVGTYDPYRFIMRAAYIPVMSALLGYLAQFDKRHKAERSVIARSMGGAQPELGLSKTIEGVLSEILRFYDATGALLPVLDKLSGRAYLTECKTSNGLQKVRITELQGGDQEAYLFPSPAHAWYWSASNKSRSFAVDERGEHLPGVEIVLDKRCGKPYTLDSALAVNVTFGEELSGRLYIVNPLLRASPDTEVHFMQQFARQVTPVIYTVYLWRRLRSKIGAIERAQIARDLHDGVIQSLVGLELSIQEARDQTEGPHREALLGQIQVLLRDEIRQLRELANQLRSMSIRPGELLAYLVDMVERFGRDTGISARLLSDNEDVELPPRICRHIVAIVQEGLANVRKHSGARKVLVRFNCERGVWSLVIDDDGRGFDFAGALSFVELEQARKGPVSIKERVRLLKGDLIIESNPGSGSRLFISAPVRPA